jgi:NAD(P)-dependent dehydrogenase (short-subunit alcohol dehydrogenase family)
MGFLDGKVAVVTGGNRGIGRGIVEALAKEGANVILTARSAEGATRAAGEVGAGARGVACDVRSYEAVRSLFQEADRAHGGLDVLVNNAGIGVFAPLADLSPDDWRAVIETNLNGVTTAATRRSAHEEEGRQLSSTSPRWPAGTPSPTAPPTRQQVRLNGFSGR